MPSKNPSKKALPLKNLLRTLLRSVRLHDPLQVGVHPKCGLHGLHPLDRSLSDELKKAVAVSEEKSRSVPEGFPDFQQPCSLPDSAQTMAGIAFLGGRFRYFLYFFLLREGEGGVRGAGPEGGMGDRFLLKSAGGGVSRMGGAEGPGWCLQQIGNFGGGG